MLSYQVDGAKDWWALLDCNLTWVKQEKREEHLHLTFTTSNGLTMIASVTPAPRPARE